MAQVADRRIGRGRPVDLVELFPHFPVELRLETLVDHRLVGNLNQQLVMLAIHGEGRYHHAVKFAPAGDNAILVELGEVDAAELHAATARVNALPFVLACIPGHSSLYVICDRSPDAVAIGSAIIMQTNAQRREPRLHRMRVVFDGPDLDELLTRVPLDAFLARVRELQLKVRYLGFRGGFGYLDGWPAEWAMPRRPTSRPHVARGTFAVAGSVAGFYPIDSPGGWNLLGRTDANLEYALSPGDGIAIEPVRELSFDDVPSPRQRGVLRRAEIIASPLATVVAPADWSRIDRGIPPGGAFDDVAAAIATCAVAGEVELIECAIAFPRLRFREDVFVAWCGPDLRVTTRSFRSGEEFAPEKASGGLRGYVAIGEKPGVITSASRGGRTVIRAMAGPHDSGIRSISCEVTQQLNRVGIRLRPLEPLDVAAPADLRSCGMQCGTVQLHPDGTLVAMGPEHPVTGGYLQPMTVLTTERWKLAQLMPGERITFEVVSAAAQSP